MKRNCWTCQHDRPPAGDGMGHTCIALSSLGVEEWIERHVAPDSPGVPPSMPPKDAPPCPAWQATVKQSLTVRSGGDA